MASSPKKRWLRFSVRTLLLVVLVISGLFAYVVNQARENDRLITRARWANADLEFATWGPDWMRQWMGERYFRQPVTIYVPQDFVGGCLPILRDAPSIKTLTIVDFCEYTGDHWRQIEKVSPDVVIRHMNSNEVFANPITCKTYESGTPESSQMSNMLKQIPPSRATPGA